MRIKRTLALCLVLVLVLSIAAAAATMGDRIDGWQSPFVAGARLARGVYWTGSDYRSENYIELDAGGAVFPMVVSADTICSARSFSASAASIEKTGLHVVAGINGGYYDTSNYEPVGILVKDGRLLCSDEWQNAVGFYENGGCIIGQPGMSGKVTIAGQTQPLSYINKARTDDAFALFSSDYAPTTKTKNAGTDIICYPVTGGLKLNGELTLKVSSVEVTPVASSIPAGGYVLSLSDKAPEGLRALTGIVAAGDTITVKITCNDGWSDVKYAVGSLYRLVTAGMVNSELGAGASLESRTAIGVKPDGTIVLYTMDGRQSGKSVGAMMTQVANRLIELGCTEAGLLDGGGSTSMDAIYIGDSSLSLINSPSEGSQRVTSTYIMLVTAEKATGIAETLAVYPLSAHMLSGAQLKTDVKASDKNGYAAAVPAGVTLSASAGIGEMSKDGVFTATGAGAGEISASGAGLISGGASITVVESPDEIFVKNKSTGTTLKSVVLMAGKSVSLSAAASANHVELISDASCYTWNYSGSLGSFTENGVFTAGNTAGSGEITVSAGGKSVTIPVTVARFDDVSSDDWFYDAVIGAATRGYFSGTGNNLFDPSGKMTRAMLVTVLHRAAGLPETNGGSVFSDVQAGQWYSQAVAWAEAKGIVSGVGGGKFQPDGYVTREQVAAILYRYFGSPSGQTAITGFSDADKISSWAVDAMRWAVNKGYINGKGGGMLDPASSITRAEVASLLLRCF